MNDSSADHSRIALSREEMREFGYRVVDLLAEHFANVQDGPVGAKRDPAQLVSLFDQDPPETACDPNELLAQLERDVFPNNLHVDHPRFFAFVPGPNNFVSTMADALAAGFNIFNGTWLGGSAAAADSVLQDRVAGATVYFSDQTHSSVERALRVIGFLPDQMRKLESDNNFRLSIQSLRAAIANDRAKGLRPFCVIANAGTTNTGAVDPLPELADLAAEEKLWLHIDGAFGAAAVLSERGREMLRGLERADSISLDPHKWLFQSFECGCVLARDAALLKSAFQIKPDYLRDVHRGLEEFNPCDYGVQLTRSFRALKVWLSLQTFGLAAFRKAITRGFELAELAERELRARKGWQILSPAQMATVCFRFGNSDELQTRLVDEMMKDGYALLTSTELRGAVSLRLCTINPRTTEEDIIGTVERLDRFARQ